MKEASRNKLPPILDNTVVTRELQNIRKVLDSPGPTQVALDKWLTESPERDGVFHDTFWGSIRWPKSLGRSSAKALADGFSMTLRNHFTIHEVGAGGADIVKDGWMEMAAPNMWDVADDSEHYRVNYSGYYARYNLYVDLNELKVTIAGSWTNPSKFGARFLLPNPLGYVFGSFDGHPIVLDEITVESHLIQPVPVWSVRL